MAKSQNNTMIFWLSTINRNLADREVADGYIERTHLLASCYQISIPSFVIERLNTLFSETDPDIHEYSCLDIRRDPSTADVEKISTKLAEPGYLPKSHSMNNMISSYDDILKELKGLNSLINKGGMKHWTEHIYTTKKHPVLFSCIKLG